MRFRRKNMVSELTFIDKFVVITIIEIDIF